MKVGKNEFVNITEAIAESQATGDPVVSSSGRVVYAPKANGEKTYGMNRNGSKTYENSDLGKENKKYLDSLLPESRHRVLSAFSKKYGMSVKDTMRELIGPNARESVKPVRKNPALTRNFFGSKKPSATPHDLVDRVFEKHGAGVDFDTFLREYRKLESEHTLKDMPSLHDLKVLHRSLSGMAWKYPARKNPPKIVTEKIVVPEADLNAMRSLHRDYELKEALQPIVHAACYGNKITAKMIADADAAIKKDEKFLKEMGFTGFGHEKGKPDFLRVKKWVARNKLAKNPDPRRNPSRIDFEKGDTLIVAPNMDAMKRSGAKVRVVTFQATALESGVSGGKEIYMVRRENGDHLPVRGFQIEGKKSGAVRNPSSKKYFDHDFKVYVEGTGNVYEGESLADAMNEYRNAVEKSKSRGNGRGCGENVSLFGKGMELLKSHRGWRYPRGRSAVKNPSKCKYEVIVGNVGRVFEGTNREEARDMYNNYVKMSKSGKGRPGGEDVVLLCDGVQVKGYNATTRQ